MPEWKPEIRAWLAGLNLDGAREAAIVDELAQHLDDRFDELRARGVLEEEARRQVLEELIGEGLLARELRRVEHWGRQASVSQGERKANFLEEFLRDWKYAARQLMKNPGFTVVAVLTLALGIGVNLALFALLNDQLLRPRPVSHPEELWAIRPSDSSGQPKFLNLSTPYYKAIRGHPQLFQGVIGFGGFGARLREPEGWEDLSGLLVSGDYFSFLGVQPVIGRGFLAEEDSQPGASRVVVISYRLWERHFLKDPAILGKTLNLDDQIVEVVGVAPRDFERFSSRDLWAPLSMKSFFGFGPGYSPVYSMLGRLRPGESPARAADSLAPIVRDVTKALGPQRAKPRGVPPYAANNANLTRVAAVRAGYGVLADEWYNRGPLLRGVSLAAIGTLLVLLIAGSNLANLLLARALNRRKEMAVRLALGASRWKLARQMMVEGLLLAALGGLAATLLLACLSQSMLPIMSVAGYQVRSLFPDGRIMAAALFAGLATGAGFSALPALRATRFDPLAALKGGGDGRQPRRWSLQQALVVAQVGGSLVLLSGVGLCLRDIGQLLDTEVGFRPDAVVVVRTRLEKAGFTTNTAPIVAEELRRRFSELPGVEVVGMSAKAPFDGWHGTLVAGEGSVEGYTTPPGVEVGFGYAYAGPDSFRALGVPIIAGRDISDDDFAAHRPVVLVNQSFARKFWPGRSVVGQHLQFRVFHEVVGVVADARLDTPAEPPEPMAFFAAHSDDHYALNPTFIIRARGNAQSLVGPIRTELARVDPRLAGSPVFTARQAMRTVLRDQRNALNLLAGLAALALGLTVLGAYGIMSYLVAQRTREIGIRMAVGARRADVARLVLGSGLRIAWVGLGLGLPATLAGSMVLKHAVFGVRPFDPPAFGAAALAVLLAILLACWPPARRATRVDPMEALRCE